MKQSFYFFLIFVFAATISSSVSAQSKAVEAQVAEIRKLYAEINERIAAGLEDGSAGLHHAAATIGGERDGQPWRAVGQRTERTDFYFDCEPDDPECPGDPRNLIVKITGSLQVGSGGTSRFEYLFNPKGELVFAFSVEPETMEEGEKMVERRFYFAGKKLIRVNRDNRNFDGNFTRADAEGASEVLADARRLQNLFVAMLGE